MNKKVRVLHERTVYTHAELYSSASALLSEAREVNAPYMILYALVGFAFSFEAYVNFLGEEAITHWSQIERISTESKLIVLHEHFKLKANYSKRPYQTLKQLQRFRNFMAHARSESQTEITEHEPGDPIPNRRNYPQMKWEKYCTIANAERVQEDVKTIMESLFAASGLRDGAFGILGHGGSSILRDA